MKIVLDGLIKEYAGQRIIGIDSFEFRSGKKTVLLGRNGCGKSTLFALIAGSLEADAGRVIRDKGSLALLEQEFPPRLAGATLFDTAADACAHLAGRERELAQYEENFSGLCEVGQMRYAALREAYERDGGYDWRREVRKVLEGLHFCEEDFARGVRSFSGGERRRALLARALLLEPDCLLLDEPSNHLDLEAAAWLERWLAARRKTTLIITHDRRLIDALADEIAELKGGSLERYPAPFAAFREERMQRRAIERKQWKAQQEFIERTEDFIRKNLAGQKTKQAQARRRMLMRVERLKTPERDPHWRLKLARAKQESSELARAENLSVRYQDAVILDSISFAVYRGEKIAVIGANGSGKSTLLKTLLGAGAESTGELYLDPKLAIGYFPQEGGGLDPEKTVLEEIMSDAPLAGEEEMRSMLGGFLFSGDHVHTRVADLSGGEKSRLLLARLFLRQPNLLIMDEVTNHLDLESRILLENALMEYDGSLIFVSHDRAFIDAIATSIWDIRGGRLTRYEGNIRDNEERLYGEKKSGSANKDPEEASRAAPRTPGAKSSLYSRGANKFRMEKIEKEIADLEQELNILQEEMLRPNALRDGRIYAGLKLRHTELSEQLHTRYAEWETICG
ncbi:MAG: ABC-F family ATP-binding cassette domain-containing protein [Spirochaetota bacterium]|jgi:ATP-binding cassette subfamily F protein 3|nr:ABC-F family ATP-binding cassette domain-containing protein [Spirochaetota bacterium]